MWTKNAKAMSVLERGHVESVKRLPCSVCDKPAPSDAHHPRQGLHFLCVALCKDCHQGALNGWHGQRRGAWAVRKMDEWSALAVTLQRLEDRRCNG